ncbi:conserved hypothetical protein [Burkholderiales bacterium]|nr:conserved hypothetical protein [Burkholderiales bacterium]
MTDEEVARFLQDNPAFFQQHPGLLTDLLLPDPHQGNAVSLIERQALLLRERVKVLEARLAELIRIGRDNDALARNLVDWTRALLEEPDRGRRAPLAVAELQRIFAIPLAEIRTWSEAPGEHDAQAARLVSSLHAPVCGCDIDLTPFRGLAEVWSEVRSVALVPLRRAGQREAFGLLALGSSDPARFEATLGTAVLARIGELASAALAPLHSGTQESAPMTLR